MFDIGWSELLVIAVVAIIFIGPKDLPRLMRTFGHYVGKVRHMASDFQRQFEAAVRDSDIDEVRKALHEVQAQTPPVDFRAPLDKPLMTPKPPAPVAATPAPKAPSKKPPKPRAKRASARAKPASPKPRQTRKPKERKP